jgi:hypothetical protein
MSKINSKTNGDNFWKKITFGSIITVIVTIILLFVSHFNNISAIVQNWGEIQRLSEYKSIIYNLEINNNLLYEKINTIEDNCRDLINCSIIKQDETKIFLTDYEVKYYLNTTNIPTLWITKNGIVIPIKGMILLKDGSKSYNLESEKLVVTVHIISKNGDYIILSIKKTT